MEEELIDDPMPVEHMVQSTSEIPSTISGNLDRDTSTDDDKKNPIYDYFIREAKDVRVCKGCKTKIAAKTGTTTAVINHLKRKHASDFKAYELKKTQWLKNTQLLKKQKLTTKLTQPSIKSLLLKNEKWPPTNPQAIKITNQIGKFVVGGFHSYSIVEETEFKALMELTSPRYQVPSRTTFSRSIIPKMHEDLKNKIKSELRNLNDLQSWSFTTDGWTSRKNDGYMSLTSHFLDNFQMRSYCLALKKISVQHTGANICTAIKEIIQEWEIDNIINHPSKIPIYAVTDGAANMKSAINFSNRWIHIDCFGHVLQLCVEDAIKETTPVSHLMAKCRAIVGHYSRSTQANSRLHAEQVKLGVKPLELIQDVPTRWNSQYFMLERLIRCRNAVNLELGTSDTQVNTLKGAEWTLAENVVKILEPLVEATQISSGETYPTISAVLPMIFGIEKVFSEIEAKVGPIQFGESIKKNLKARFGPLESNPIYLVSTLIDPKYKLQGLKPHFHVPAQLHLKREMTSLSTQSQTATSKVKSAEDVPPSTSRSIFKFLDDESHNESSKEDDIELQVNMFLKSQKIKPSEKSLTWWKTNQNSFPRIARVALKYLGIPATSVPSERLFSSAGNVITSRRKELLPEHAQQLVVLHDNIKHL